MAAHAWLRLPSDPLPVQVQNKAEWNARRPRETADFFTVGYMKRDAAGLVAALKTASVASVLDVRYSPVSMYRPEFSKRNLQRILEENGIHYLHLPYLGVPRDVRGQAVGQTNRDAIWEWYDKHVVMRYFGRNLHHFLNVAPHPVALLCVELDPMACHRHRLSLALERNGLRGCDL